MLVWMPRVRSVRRDSSVLSQTTDQRRVSKETAQSPTEGQRSAEACEEGSAVGMAYPCGISETRGTDS